MQSTTARWLQRATRALVAILWLGTLLVALGWLLHWDLPFEPEPVTALLGLVSVAMYVKFTDRHLRFLDET
jgi:hypothetical protein